MKASIPIVASAVPVEPAATGQLSQDRRARNPVGRAATAPATGEPAIRNRDQVLI